MRQNTWKFLWVNSNNHINHLPLFQSISCPNLLDLTTGWKLYAIFRRFYSNITLRLILIDEIYLQSYFLYPFNNYLPHQSLSRFDFILFSIWKKNFENRRKDYFWIERLMKMPRKYDNLKRTQRFLIYYFFREWYIKICKNDVKSES